MALESFNAYHSYLTALEPLNDAERGRLFTALLVYSGTGEVLDLRGNERFVFPQMKWQIDRDKGLYCEKSAARSEAGKLGAAARWGMASDSKNSKCHLPYGKNGVEKDKDKDKDKDKEKEREKEDPYGSKKKERKSAPRFSPPTVDEVAAYCQERGNTVDAERFVDFYAAKGWKVGANSMQDWKAAVRTWERGDNRGRKRAQSEPVSTADRLAQMIRDGEFGD